MHKTGHVLNTLPKSLQLKAKQALHDIWQADARDNAEKALELFVKAYEPKYLKATLCLQKDREELLAFYDFPAQHWQGLRTTILLNRRLPTTRHRTKRFKGCLSRDGMLHMLFNLSQCAEKNWRKLRGFNYFAKVVKGVPFKGGVEIDKSNRIAA